MATLLVPDELWSMVEALLPAPKPRPKSGRPPLDNHAAPTGIIFVLKSGIPWEMLPQMMGCGMTCWRRLRDWQARGYGNTCAAAGGACAKPTRSTGAEPRWTAPRCRRRGGGTTGRSSADRGKPGTKRHVVVDRRGTPLGLLLRPANRNDSKMLAAALDAVPPTRPMIIASVDASAASATSSRASPGVGSTEARSSADTPGLPSAPSPDSIASGA